VLTAKSIKAAIVLDTAEVATLVVQDGKPFPGVRVSVAGAVVLVSLSAKGVRKTLAAIRDNGVENVVIILQGKLKITTGSVTLEEAGIVAQPKVKKETPAAEVVVA
jgi:hypothetical protein